MENEIKLWLREILKEDIDDYSVKNLGNSEKGDGYVGDIVFVSLLPKTPEKKPYNLVLKCSKKSPALREKFPVKQLFLQEILMYETVLPEFVKFQKEKGLDDVFDKIPKCYGSFIAENTEVIALENLKVRGFALWGRKEPFTQKHIEMILSEYAKLHGTAIAMQQQQPDQFQALVDCFGEDAGYQFLKTINSAFVLRIEEIRDALKGDLDEKILEQWTSLKDKILDVFDQLNDSEGVKVINHGDCWNNNFIFKHDINNRDFPVDVAILDWQTSKYFSPVLDISYFLFSAISNEDIDQMEYFFEFYYKKMKIFTRKLGSNLEELYPFEQFLKDWKKHCKIGLLLSCLTLKITVTEKEDLPSLEDFAKKDSSTITATLNYGLKNKDLLKERAKHLVKYVVENDLI